MLYVGKVSDGAFSNSFFLHMWVYAHALSGNTSITVSPPLTIFTPNYEIGITYYSEFPFSSHIGNNMFMDSDFPWKYAENCAYSIFGLLGKNKSIYSNSEL